VTGSISPDKFGYQLVGRVVSGEIAGGVVSQIYGGNFWQGFAQGAATAAAGFLFNETMHAAEKGLLEDTITYFLEELQRGFSWGIGGVLGIVDVNWNSSNPTETNVNAATLQVGAGLNFCYTRDFSKTSGDVIPLGSRYLGISVDTKFNSFCVNISVLPPVSVFPINWSHPVTTIGY
jgi:hypothetical protein